MHPCTFIQESGEGQWEVRRRIKESAFRSQESGPRILNSGVAEWEQSLAVYRRLKNSGIEQEKALTRMDALQNSGSWLLAPGSWLKEALKPD
jgi:hypothetical protein